MASKMSKPQCTQRSEDLPSPPPRPHTQARGFVSNSTRVVPLYVLLFSDLSHMLLLILDDQVPRRSESLMGQTLQAPLHAEASAQTALTPDREPELAFHGPQATMVGGVAPIAQDLSRASRTRCALSSSDRNTLQILLKLHYPVCAPRILRRHNKRVLGFLKYGIRLRD